MSRIALVTLALLAAAPARAETVVRGPGSLSIDCDDLRLSPNGTIESGRGARPACPDKTGSLRHPRFGPKVTSSSGIDLDA